MRILLLNQFFWPDSAATSQLLTDLARGLKDRGHDVYVICTDGEYAVKDESNDPRVNIERIKAAPFKRGKLARALTYASFLIACIFRGLLSPRPDLVITLTTPPLLSLIGTLIKTFRGSNHFIWEMDVYPDVAVDLNYIKAGGFLDRIAGALADYSRRKADGVLALGNCMRRRLMARGIPGEMIHVADNWVDGEAIRPVPRPVVQDRLVLLYSGNLGLAHDADTLSDAMQQLKEDVRFRFIFAGGGSLRKHLEERCREMNIAAAEFRSYSLRAELGDSLGACDVGLITQRKSCLGSVVPSKIYGLLAAGRPVLFVGPAESTVAEIISRFRCGWQINNGDVSGLISLLKSLASEPLQVEIAGRRARKAFEENYDLPLGVARVCSYVGAASPKPVYSKVFGMAVAGRERLANQEERPLVREVISRKN
jgi:colanic acid biosynthesis glycosyl transferase WcaI